MTNIEWTRTAELTPNRRNARTHSKKQIGQIAESIKVFNFLVPILVDESKNIIAGHGRYTAAQQLGLHEVPVITVNGLSKAKKRALALADNKIAENAGWDREILSIELDELSVALPEIGLDVGLTGFDAGEVDVILADVEEENANHPDEETCSVPADPIAQLGDVWTLGRHRIICGDARDTDTLQRVLGSETIDMVFCDPPYNVRIRDIVGRGKIKHDEFAMASGEMSEDEFASFLEAVLANAVQVSHDGALHYVCMDWRHIADLITAGREHYSELKNICVWAKNNGGQGSLYRSAHELIAVFKVGTADHTNNVELGRHGRYRTNVWHYAGVNTFKTGRDCELALHPTVKPVALVADAIKDVTRRGALVLDLFGGSGTTLIAAERTGRCARLIEIEPRYVDVTIKRFETLTKSDAILARTGMTFSDVARDRSTRAN